MITTKQIKQIKDMLAAHHNATNAQMRTMLAEIVGLSDAQAGRAVELRPAYVAYNPEKPGAWVKVFRNVLGMHQTDFARLLNYSGQKEISRIETNKRIVSGPVQSYIDTLMMLYVSEGSANLNPKQN